VSVVCLAVTACHDSVVLPYAAYLRVYEPLTAFPEEQRRRWAEYVVSEGRPDRATALAAEQTDALRRLTANPPVAAPECESGEAYVRWADGTTYVCPWQTRLRSWLAVARLRAVAPVLARGAFPADHGRSAVRDFARWPCPESSLRVYIQASTWSVPFAWFVPFTADERWLALGSPGDRSEAGEGGRATAAGTRTLIYTTTMSQARRRVARALGITRPRKQLPKSRAASERADLSAGLVDVGSWLAEFHPHSLLELDYGGLVHLLDDGALCGDQSVAEVSAAIGALATGEIEFAKAMYGRIACRWRKLHALERAN
jgi:hypothetical protein